MHVVASHDLIKINNTMQGHLSSLKLSMHTVKKIIAYTVIGRSVVYYQRVHDIALYMYSVLQYMCMQHGNGNTQCPTIVLLS